MRHASWFVCLIGVLANAAAAQESIHWQPNLEAAQALAARTHRLVLIHFWAPWCGPCMNMEKNVFAQPETGPALEANFVMVKLNADDSKATARVYQVKMLPTDVIVTPSGRLIAAIPSPAKPQQYIAAMNQAAEGYKRVAQGPPGGAMHEQAAANPYGAVQTSSQAAAQAAERQAPAYAAAYAPAAAAQQPPAAAPQYATDAPQVSINPSLQTPPSGAPYAGQNNQHGYPQGVPGAGAPAGVAAANATSANIAVAGYGQPAAASPYATAPSYSAPAYSAAMPGGQAPPQAAPAGPTDALDGFCCVTLVDRKRWVKGDVRFGAIHRGRVYKFVSQEAQQRFLANPDAFSPVIQGNDPVLALDVRQAVPGSREHGLFYQNRIYLFSSEESLKRFQSSPGRYAAEVTQAMR